jgi:hypothetical protein
VGVGGGGWGWGWGVGVGGGGGGWGVGVGGGGGGGGWGWGWGWGWGEGARGVALVRLARGTWRRLGRWPATARQPRRKAAAAARAGPHRLGVLAGDAGDRFQIGQRHAAQALQHKDAGGGEGGVGEAAGGLRRGARAAGRGGAGRQGRGAAQALQHEDAGKGRAAGVQGARRRWTAGAAGQPRSRLEPPSPLHPEKPLRCSPSPPKTPPPLSPLAAKLAVDIGARRQPPRSPRPRSQPSTAPPPPHRLLLNCR